MAYKFQLGAFRASGSLTQEGGVTAEDSALSGSSLNIGSAVLSAAELEVLDDVTAGTGAASKAMVLDASRNIDTINILSASILRCTHLSASADSITIGSTTLSESELGLVDSFADETASLANDSVIFFDADVSKFRRESFGDLSALMAGDGIAASSGVLSVGVDDSTVELSSDAVRVKASGIQDSHLHDNVATGLAGDGLGASSGVLAVQVSGALAIANDKVGISGSIAGQGLQHIGGLDSISSLKVDLASNKGLEFDSDKLAVKLKASTSIQVDADGLKVELDPNGGLEHNGSTGIKLKASTAGVGIAHNTGVLSLDINEVDTATLQPSADFIPFVDNSDGNATKKVTFANLAASLSGNGLVQNNNMIAIQTSGSVVVASDKLGISGSIAGAGLGYAGGVDSISSLLVNVDDSSIEISSDSLQVKALGVTNGMLAGSIANAKLINDNVTIGSTSVALGGTATSFAGLTGLDFTAASATIAGSIGGNTLTLGGATSTVKIAGDLEVVGTVNTVSTTELLVEDKTIRVASGSANDANCDESGILIGDGGAYGARMFFDATATIAGQTRTNFLKFEKGNGSEKIDLVANKFVGESVVPINSINPHGTLAPGVNVFSNFTASAAVNLPASADSSVGDAIRIKAPVNCGDGNTFYLTINRAGSQTIDGGTSVLLESPNAAIELVYVASDEWKVF